MEEHGGDIYARRVNIDFSVNINPLGIPEKVRKEAMRGVEMSEHYPDVHHTRLLDKMEKAYQIPKEHITLGSGAIELIYALVHATKPQSGLIVEPTFLEYEKALDIVDCRRDFYIAPEENEFEIGMDFLDIVRDGSYDIVFLCNPNNPTGRLIKKKRMQELLEICEQKDTLLVVDECFMDFVKKGKNHSLLGRYQDYQHLIVVKAFTKIFSMPGLRLGYAVTANEELRKKIRKMLPPWNVSIPAQFAGVAALGEKDFVERSKDYLFGEREWMENELKKLGVKVYPSRTNYLLFRGPEGMDDWCMKEYILIRNAENFRGLSKGYYRIGIKSRKDNEKLIQVLKKHRMEIEEWSESRK